MMIKLMSIQKNGTPLVLLGLSEKNVEKLKEGKPIVVEMDKLGVPGTCVIVYGETEEKIADELRSAGMVIAGEHESEA